LGGKTAELATPSRPQAAAAAGGAFME